jgi:hypothetical protein
VLPVAGAANVNCPATIPTQNSTGGGYNGYAVIAAPTCPTGSNAGGYDVNSISAYIGTVTTAGKHLRCSLYDTAGPPKNHVAAGCDTVEATLAATNNAYITMAVTGACHLAPATAYAITCAPDDNSTAFGTATAACTNCFGYVGTAYPTAGWPATLNTSGYSGGAPTFYVTATPYTGTTTTSTTLPPPLTADWSSDSRFVAIYNFETSDGSDSAPAPKNNLLPNVLNPAAYTASVWQGTKAADWTNGSASLYCDTSNGCAPSEFQFTSGDFTTGLALKVPSGIGVEYLIGSENGVQNSIGWCLALQNNGGHVNQVLFQILPVWPTFTNLYSDAAYTVGTWFSTTARFTASSALMELFTNGLLQTTTATATGSPGNHAGWQIIPTPNRGETTDETWVFAGKMAAADVLRIHVCGIDGKQCTCNAGTPTTYASRPRYVSGTMPACNATGPQ